MEANALLCFFLPNTANKQLKLPAWSSTDVCYQRWSEKRSDFQSETWGSVNNGQLAALFQQDPGLWLA